jgi:hypothetical protein
MKNIKVKIKNEDEDGKEGSEEKPMIPARNVDLKCPKPEGQSPRSGVKSR